MTTQTLEQRIEDYTNRMNNLIKAASGLAKAIKALDEISGLAAIISARAELKKEQARIQDEIDNLTRVINIALYELAIKDQPKPSYGEQIEWADLRKGMVVLWNFEDYPVTVLRVNKGAGMINSISVQLHNGERKIVRSGAFHQIAEGK